MDKTNNIFKINYVPVHDYTIVNLTMKTIKGYCLVPYGPLGFVKLSIVDN